MRFEIRNDLLMVGGVAARFVPARDVGGRIVPTLIVLHDTAGGLDAEGSISWLAGNPNKTSAHFVVGRDGAVTQLAAPDRKCNHAGKSSWRGREFCNGFAIGIEIVNPGKLLARGDGAVADFGKVYDRAQYGIGCCSTPEHGDGYWMPYTPEQMAAVEQLVAALGAAYPSIKEVVGHHDISPRRKVDPTPLMDWPRMRAALAARAWQPATGNGQHLSDEHVEQLQARLKALGYYMGLTDGQLGAKTVGAISAFQLEHGLATNGRLDSATVAALRSETAKPMPTGHREEATPKSLVEQGSQTMAAALDTQSAGKMQAALAAVSGVLVAGKTFVQEAGVEIVIVFLLVVVAIYGLKQIKRGSDLAEHRLAEHKAGIR
jgi:N-acetyl-anhydromuramyl-L-alanine amidase AmpD